MPNCGRSRKTEIVPGLHAPIFQGSPKKVSTYIGRLTKDAGLIPKGSRGSRPPSPPWTVREYGNATLMAEEFGDLLPVLQNAFPDCWQELVALTFSRVTGYTPLSRVADARGWNSTTSSISILIVTPAPSPGYSQRSAVTAPLKRWSSSTSSTTSRLSSPAPTVNLAEFATTPMISGSRRSTSHSSARQAQSGMSPPSSGHSRSSIPLARPSSLTGVLSQWQTRTCCWSQGFSSSCHSVGRNSRRYNTQIHLADHFFYHKRLIHAGNVRWRGSDALPLRGCRPGSGGGEDAKPAAETRRQDPGCLLTYGGTTGGLRPLQVPEPGGKT